MYNWSVGYRVQDCAISPNGKRMVVISSECQIVVYDFETREECYCILVKSRMTCVKISRDSRHMLVNMANSEVHLIDIDTAEIVRRFLGQQQGEYVIRSTFGGADQNLVISGSEGMSSISLPWRNIALTAEIRCTSLHLAQRKRNTHRNSGRTSDARLRERCCVEPGRPMHVCFRGRR